MVAKAKVQLEYKLDPDSKLANFIEWYKVAYTTTNENGRKRQGNARKAILNFLENYLGARDVAEMKKFDDCVKQFLETSKLPKELQMAKNKLSNDEYETFKKLADKINADD